jgi:hypothetical protein
MLCLKGDRGRYGVRKHKTRNLAIEKRRQYEMACQTDIRIGGTMLGVDALGHIMFDNRSVPAFIHFNGPSHLKIAQMEYAKKNFPLIREGKSCAATNITRKYIYPNERRSSLFRIERHSSYYARFLTKWKNKLQQSIKFIRIYKIYHNVTIVSSLNISGFARLNNNCTLTSSLNIYGFTTLNNNTI